MTSSNPKETIDFGFQQVDREAKAGKVHEIFANVADRYDVMNDLMSGGMHRLWKDHFVAGMPTANGAKLLDMAGGTGDIAFRYINQAQKRGHDVNVTISDINAAMLEQGEARALDKGITQPITWQVADAENLPFEDNSFDLYSIAFGIRNVTNKDKALREVARVLKPGGQFFCLEFSHVEQELVKQLYDFYSFKVIPEIGSKVTGDRDAYQYLVESIRMFPKAEEFAGMMEEAGLSRVRYDALTMGVVAIHRGWKL